MSIAKKKDITNLGDIYGNILNNVKKNIIQEGKVKEVIGDAPLQKGGPQEKSGFQPTKLDKKKMSKKELDDNLYNINDLSDNEDGEEVKKAKKETRKIARESLNNFMSKKSIFDKLYENVMFPNGGQDEEQDYNSDLGLDDATPDSELGDEGADEVTITLDRATAEKLYEVLGACCGEGAGEDEGMGEEEGAGEEDFGGEYSDNEEDEENLGGATTFSTNIDYGKNNKVSNLKPAGGTASSAYTDKVGADGDHGHALVNAKQPNMGKNNKVGNLKQGQGALQR